MHSILLSIPFVLVSVNAQFTALLGRPAQLQPQLASLDPQGIQACLVATSNADGAAVVIENCANADVNARTWTVVNGGPTEETPPAGPIKIFGNKCLDVTNGNNQNGNKLQIWTCDANNANKNQLFNYGGDFSINWNGTTKCVDLTNGSAQNGNQIQIWDCVPRSPNQLWDGYAPPNVKSTGELVFGGISNVTLCIVAASNEDGAEVAIDQCTADNNPGAPRHFPNSNQTWIIPSTPLTGQISTFGNKCLDVTNGANADGTKLQIWTCADGNTNQQWKTSANNTLVWSGKNKCVDLTGGNQTLGNPIQIWTCAGNSNQKWNYLLGQD